MNTEELKKALDIFEEKIEKVCLKLGIASNKIFPYFVRYCLTESLLQVIVSFLIFISILLGVAFVWFFIPEDYAHEVSLRSMLLLLGFACGLISLIFLFNSVYTFALVFLNKEIKAFDEIKDRFLNEN